MLKVIVTQSESRPGCGHGREKGAQARAHAGRPKRNSNFTLQTCGGFGRRAGAFRHPENGVSAPDLLRPARGLGAHVGGGGFPVAFPALKPDLHGSQDRGTVQAEVSLKALLLQSLDLTGCHTGVPNQ